MDAAELDVVTGAFSYTGKYITHRLLANGRRVRTLTGHPDHPDPFGGRGATAPYAFDDPAALTASLRGADTLFNTYWVRFCRGGVTFDQAVGNSRILFRAARNAGVRRIVHTSVTNPSADSQLPYFRGKALVEQALAESGVSYAILRPALLFAPEDVLINNIAWMLRRCPIFAVLGRGDYRLQPIFAEDYADLAVEAARRDEDIIQDAVGPETFTFDELVRLIAEAIGSRAWIVHVRPGLALFLSRLLGMLVGDVVLTRDEADGLMADLLATDAAPVGHTRLSDWLRANADGVGRRYASALSRHFRGLTSHTE